MPIVGILRVSVISFEVFEATHSNTIANAPAFSIDNASFKSFKDIEFDSLEYLKKEGLLII